MRAQRHLHAVTFALLLATTLALGCSDSGPTDPNGGDGGDGPAPTATITQPADGATYTDQETVELQGSANDPEDGELTGSALTWHSSQDGRIGSGTRASSSSLSDGSHTIRLVATDTDNNADTADVDITIQQNQAQGNVYGTSSDTDALHTVDPSSGSMTRVGSLDPDGSNYETPVGMVERPGDGQLFVWNNTNPPNTLARVDRCTGEATVVASGLDASGKGMAWGPNGTLYALNVALYELDPAAGTATEVGDITNLAGDVGAAAFDAQGRLLAIELTDQSPALLEVDPTSGAATVLGEISTDIGVIGGLDLDDQGRLWGTGFNGPRGDILFRLDPSGPTVSDIRSLDSDAPQGLVFGTACGQTPSDGQGSLEVTTSTLGSDVDSDGYTVDLDQGAQSQAIGIDDTVTFTGLSSGDHEVDLQGVASNCSVDGTDPRTVNIPAGGTASTSYSVNCDQTSDTNSITVATTSTGTQPDPDGYTAVLQDYDSLSIAANGEVTFEDVPSNTYLIHLTGEARNCTISSGEPRSATVGSGNRSERIEYTVNCPAEPNLQFTETVQLDKIFNNEGDDRRPQMADVWGAAPDNVFAISQSEDFYRYDGTSWKALSTTSFGDATIAIHGADGNDVMAVGGVNNSQAWHWDGSSWTKMGTPADHQLVDVWMADNGEAYAVSYNQSPDEAELVHWDGSTWTVQKHVSVEFSGIFGFGPDDVYAAGLPTNSLDASTLWHYDGTGWTQIHSGLDQVGRGKLWGASDTRMFSTSDFAAAPTGMWDGTQWSTIWAPRFGNDDCNTKEPTGLQGRLLTGSTSNGELMLLEERTDYWQGFCLDAPVSTQLSSVASFGTGDFVAVGENGWIVHGTF